MRIFRAVSRRWRRDAEIDKELQFHIDQQVAGHMASGLSRVEAERRARLEFGGAQQIKEQVREASMLATIDTLSADLRYAFRSLKRSPVFTVAAMFALAVGSGGTSAVASILNDLVRRPPRIFRAPHELVVVSETSPRNPAAYDEVAPAVYEQFLTARPHLRRRGGARDEVVISNGLARQYWPSTDPLGQFVQLAGEPRARHIIGIVSDVYGSPGAARNPIPYIFRPRADRADRMASQDLREWTYLLMRTSVDPRSLAPQVRARLEQMFPNRPIPLTTTLEELITRGATDLLFAAFLVGPLVLLTLMLSASGIYGLISQTVALRARELGIRAALGAGSRQLVELVVGDALRLARAGLVFGVVGVVVLNRIIMSIFVGAGWAAPLVVVAAGLLMVVVAVAASYGPASRAAKVDPMTALRHE